MKCIEYFNVKNRRGLESEYKLHYTKTITKTNLTDKILWKHLADKNTMNKPIEYIKTLS